MWHSELTTDAYPRNTHGLVVEERGFTHKQIRSFSYELCCEGWVTAVPKEQSAAAPFHGMSWRCAPVLRKDNSCTNHNSQ